MMMLLVIVLSIGLLLLPVPKRPICFCSYSAQIIQIRQSQI
jgi:hypothetical protein